MRSVLSINPSFKQQLIQHIPAMRGFALSMVRNAAIADDLVQDALLRAWEHQDQFKPDTNFKAWIFTILRNKFFTDCRQRKREVVMDDSFFEAQLLSRPEQLPYIQLEEFKAALLSMSPGFREALLLVGAAGFTIEEAAQICGVPEGTIKSRLNRGRHALRGFAMEDGVLHLPQDPASHHATQVAL